MDRVFQYGTLGPVQGPNGNQSTMYECQQWSKRGTGTRAYAIRLEFFNK